VLEEQVVWSADALVHTGTNGPSADPGQRLVLELIADDGTTVFRSDRFAYSGSEVAGFWDLSATLDCSTTPGGHE
jgi:hypothetical protein